MSPLFVSWARPDYRETLLSLGLSLLSAESVAVTWPDPGSLSGATVAQLRRHGLTPRQARQLLAAVDLAKLAHRGPTGPKLRDTADVVALLGPPLAMADSEILAVVMLNLSQRVIEVLAFSQGAPSQVSLTPGDVFRGAIRAAAARIIVAHNHPSGDPTPSVSDIVLTERLRETGRLVGIPLLDHIVIARGGDYCSLAAEGLAGFI